MERTQPQPEPAPRSWGSVMLAILSAVIAYFIAQLVVS